MHENRLLAIAASGQRVGFVFLQDQEVVFWQVSRKAGSSPKKACAVLKQIMANLNPALVLVQSADGLKGKKRKQVLNRIARAASDTPCLVQRGCLQRTHANKYAAAAALADRHPALAPHCPPARQTKDSGEPHTIVLFTALGLADQYLNEGNPVLRAAAAMG
ncbi:hypothetical protein [Fluviibacterium sp. S390]|uniref:hypothetical protein n=1 Tax=Fluviibacterium sp. S390 TaxID=3415139 RepID=UPI003C79F317